MEFSVGQKIKLKKPHPCGEKRWLVLRTGADLRLRCLGCSHEVMVPRCKTERNIRAVQRTENLST